MKSVIAVPARLESSRLPRKVLADIGGKAMLQRVLEQCALSKLATEVLLCTDSEELRDIAKGWGFNTVMTPASCSSGTDRIAFAAPNIDADVIINVQGDQPFIDPNVIDAVATEFARRTPRPSVLTPIYKLRQEGIHNINTVKTLRRTNGDAVYFSRSAIPAQRDAAPEEWAKHATYWGHVGLYAYTKEVLLQWPSFTECEPENLEKLEQLRFIDNGVVVGTIEIDEPLGEVNVPLDLDLAREIVASNRDKPTSN